MKEKFARALSGTKDVMRIGLDPRHWVRATRHFVATAVRNHGSPIYDASRPLDPGKQTVIMMPGWACDGGSMTRLGSELRRRHNVYSPDNLPRDLEALYTQMTLEEQAAMTAQYLDRFVGQHNGHASMHLAGHSNGGPVSLLTLRKLDECGAHDVRRRVKSVVTMASPIRPHPDFNVGHAPVLSRMAAAQHLRPDSPLYDDIAPYYKDLSLCIASDQDEIFPIDMQHVPERPVAQVSMSHWDYAIGGPQELRHVSGLIEGAISSSVSENRS